MLIHIYIHIYIHMCMCVFICILTSICVYVYIQLYTYIHVHVMIYWYTLSTIPACIGFSFNTHSPTSESKRPRKFPSRGVWVFPNTWCKSWDGPAMPGGREKRSVPSRSLIYLSCVYDLYDLCLYMWVYTIRSACQQLLGKQCSSLFTYFGSMWK